MLLSFQEAPSRYPSPRFLLFWKTSQSSFLFPDMCLRLQDFFEFSARVSATIAYLGCFVWGWRWRRTTSLLFFSRVPPSLSLAQSRQRHIFVQFFLLFFFGHWSVDTLTRPLCHFLHTSNSVRLFFSTPPFHSRAVMRNTLILLVSFPLDFNFFFRARPTS